MTTHPCPRRRGDLGESICQLVSKAPGLLTDTTKVPKSDFALTIVYQTIRYDYELRTRLVYVFDSEAETVQVRQSEFFSLIWQFAQDLGLGVGRLEREGRKAQRHWLVDLLESLAIRQGFWGNRGSWCVKV